MDPLTCTRCEETLDSEQSENPERDENGDVLCDSCYRDLYRDECGVCCRIVENDELESRPGELVVILREAPGLSGPVESGYYRVVKWPMFMDGMIEACFINDALERVADIDGEATKIAERTPMDGIPMCADCRSRIENRIGKDRR